jgi:hypothetical protein
LTLLIPASTAVFSIISFLSIWIFIPGYSTGITKNERELGKFSKCYPMISYEVSFFTYIKWADIGKKITGKIIKKHDASEKSTIST